ncbi:hypothetical protein ACPPVQ_15955 [Diaminobutyricibacter sp. McL0618]|uniref:hypothetical protein n=1 Tax=Leifsonia sp. McL0618 TaxID=3415677 RepID=UPI003CEA9065
MADSLEVENDSSAATDTSDQIRLWPHPLYRFGMLIPTGVVAAAAIHASAIESPTVGGMTSGVLILLGSAYVAWRAIFFTGVVCKSDVLIVRGTLWSRRIPRLAIERIPKELAVVVWRGASRRRRYTPLLPFTSVGNTAASVEEYNVAAIKVVLNWVRAAPGYVTPKRKPDLH